MSIREVLHQLIQERGRLTVAAFMDVALYHPQFGYYAGAAQRSGRSGDFFTSVDVGPIFGELIEVQIAEMARVLAHPAHLENLEHPENLENSHFDLVEAGAGNGRLSADILGAMRVRHSRLYDVTRLHLVEASAAARSAQRATLGGHIDRLVSSGADLPDGIEGVIFANELLDALPVHQVVMRPGGLREVYVAESGGDLAVFEDAPSTPELAAYLEAVGANLEAPGWRAEINLAALSWIRTAASRLRRGFIVLVDYGHEARKLYSPTHAAGTLTSFTRHTTGGPESMSQPAWLLQPGDRDITAHVDFTSVQAAGEAAGLTTLAFLDQTYFLMALAAGRQDFEALAEPAQLRRRLALRTLLMPGGLGSTHKVLIFGKHAGAPALVGCSHGTRVT